MLRAVILTATVFAAIPFVSARAEPVDASAKGAGTTTDTQSGTTTYFGKKAAEPSKTDSAKALDPKASSSEADVAEKKPVVKPRPLPPTLTAAIDLAKQTMTVSVNGEPRYRWTISSGTQQYATPTGNFYPQWTSQMWYSRKYDNAPMPHAVFINGGVAVHGTQHVKSLGMPASHGCIRLAPGNAKTFYNLVQKHGMMRTRVSVYGRPNYRDSEIAKRDRRRDSDYASNGGGWFWGNSWDQNDEPRELRKKDRKDYKYVYIDGVKTKVRRDKNGDYLYKDAQKRKRYSQSGNVYAN